MRGSAAAAGRSTMPSSSLSEAYKEALEEARRLKGPRVGDGSLIASSGPAEAAGLTLYMASLHAGARTSYSTTAEAAVHVIPYRHDIEGVIVFTADPKDSRVLGLAEAGSAMELEIVVVGPEMHGAYEARLEELGVERVIVEGAAPLLSMMIAALHWAPRMMGQREERYRRELEELGSAMEWASERYGDSIGRASRAPHKTVYYTPSTRPSAVYYKALNPGSRAAPLEEAPSAGDGGVVFMASVEEPLYRDVLLACRVRGVRLEEFKINTDPVTAPVYAAIIASLLAGSIR